MDGLVNHTFAPDIFGDIKFNLIHVLVEQIVLAFLVVFKTDIDKRIQNLLDVVELPDSVVLVDAIQLFIQGLR